MEEYRQFSLFLAAAGAGKRVDGPRLGAGTPMSGGFDRGMPKTAAAA